MDAVNVELRASTDPLYRTCSCSLLARVYSHPDQYAYGTIQHTMANRNDETETFAPSYMPEGQEDTERWQAAQEPRGIVVSVLIPLSHAVCLYH